MIYSCGSARSTGWVVPKRAWIVVFTVVLPLLLIRPTSAQTLSLGDYHRLLQDALTTLRADPMSAPQIAVELQSISSVSLPSGSSVEPDLTEIISNLKASPPQTISAETGLSAMITLLDRANSTSMSPVRIKVADSSLHTILARSEFQPQPESVSQRFTGWVRRQLTPYVGPVLQWVAHLAGRILESIAPASGFLLLGTGGFGLIALVVIVIGPLRSIRRGFGPDISRMAFGIGVKRTSARELYEQAQSLANDKAYRSAIRALYLAALLRLEERELLRFERSLTNREVLKTATAENSPLLSERLAPLVERFDRCWYGSDACSEQDYIEFAHLSDWAWEGA